MLTILVFFLFASASLLASFASVAFRETRASRSDARARQSYFLAEAGVEDASYRIRTGKAYPAATTLFLDGSAATVTVTSSANQRIIESSGNVASAVRRTRAVLKTGAGVSFAYGVQVGAGGLKLGDNSSVIGNVYANGDIIGSGASKSAVTGTAKSAGSHLIKDIRIGQDAYAASFDDCSIGGTARYLTAFTNCSAGATAVLGGPLPDEPFPVTRAQIDAWKADAAAGGTLAGYSLGNNSSGSLGPKKIAGNITLGNSATLAITGTVWVTGTISFGNGDAIRLSSSYGGTSGVIVVEGAVAVGNSTTLAGSGASGSYLMLLSLASFDPAISIGNSATSAILYAPNGVIDVGNNLALSQATAYGFDVGNGASITYESGLADAAFSSGPTGGWEIQSWGEVK